MIQISNLKLQIPHTTKRLKEKALKQLHIREQDLIGFRIAKRSLDARKKPVLYYVYTLELSVKNEAGLQKKNLPKNVNVCKAKPIYAPVPTGTETLAHAPIIAGSGPAGLFCAYSLAKMGYAPVLVERGEDVDTRMQDVEAFWNGGSLKPNSNVQFGEGGAGTFSDGKLNTLVHDKEGRGRAVLETFVKFGAPKKILYDNKPHVGTDILAVVVKRMREEICRLGGQVHFHTQVTELLTEEGKLTGIKLQDTHSGEVTDKPTQALVLAIGHSARDTFQMLFDRNVAMKSKSFAIGVRAEHRQDMIDEAMYGRKERGPLGAAAYKLTAQLENGRGVYTFCMCPGGYVVNASSEQGRLAVNGMSYHDRAGENANSAVIVTVTKDDYGSDHPLAGMEFQRRLRKKGMGRRRRQCSDTTICRFLHRDNISKDRKCYSEHKREYVFGNVRNIFPPELAESIESGIRAMGKKIKDFDHDDVILSGVESRTSSPVKIFRKEDFTSSFPWIYPCGEGAGYAGGITSAAMDGMKVAEAIIKTFSAPDSV